jgi:CRISPR locus-related DNA-binding protein
METYLNENLPITIEGKTKEMGKKVLIATVYKPEPVLLASTRLSPDILILLIDKEPDKQQEAAVELIQESLGKVIDVKTVKTEVYDIVECAKKCVDIIDMQHKEDHIFVNITSGRKPMAIGLLFAAYARHERVSKVAYNPEEDKTAIIYLPRLSFHLNESEKKILEEIGKKKYDSPADLADKIGVSPAMLYRSMDELKDQDLITVEKEGGIELTDAGKIARL